LNMIETGLWTFWWNLRSRFRMDVTEKLFFYPVEGESRFLRNVSVYQITRRHCPGYRNFQSKKQHVNWIYLCSIFWPIPGAVRSKGVGLGPLVFWECGFESRRTYGCILWMLCVVR
jgi:hypothetical protein